MPGASISPLFTLNSPLSKSRERTGSSDPMRSYSLGGIPMGRPARRDRRKGGNDGDQEDGTSSAAAPGSANREHRVPIDVRGMKIGIYRLKPIYPVIDACPARTRRHTAPELVHAGHIFLEAEENDTSFAGRSSGSGSTRCAPSRLAPMASCASLTHTAAVLSGILTPFPF